LFDAAANLTQNLAAISAYRAHRRRRSILQTLTLLLLLTPLAASAATAVNSVRVWPAAEYTRVTIESATPIVHQLLLLKNPDRLALDLEDVTVTAALQELSGKIGADDPYVKAVRVGRFKPGVVRLVFDLKSEAKPEVFTLKPIAEYGNRLVLDIYPAQAVDPLLAMLEKSQSATSPAPEPAPPAPPPATTPVIKEAKPADNGVAKAATEPTAKTLRSAKGDSQRLVIVAIDAGHGGEDPGAKGRGGTTASTFKLSISKNGKGTVTTSPNAASFAAGTVVTLTATPDPGAPWTGWAGGCTGTAKTCTLTMTKDVSVTANFK
jgi:N-acetylmuramoyl-L-alanine amidase